MDWIFYQNDFIGEFLLLAGELTYGEQLHAKLRKSSTGDIVDIALDKLQDTINMQDKTPDNFNKFDVVQIFLPIPFLKVSLCNWKGMFYL